MDVLNVETKWIKDRCYRMSPGYGTSKVIMEENYKKQNPPRSTFIEDEMDDDLDLAIVHSGNQFYISFHCPETLKGHIIGKHYKMKNILEQNGSSIKFSGEKAKSTEITVSGPTKAIVSVTYHKIQAIITKQRLVLDFTHFISLPMDSLELKASFIRFKEEILTNYVGVRGINESIFQSPSKLHVTVTPLVLLDEQDIEQAEAILNECIQSIEKDFGTKDFIVNVRGIEYMNDEPAEVDVLYAKLIEQDGNTSLQLIADKIMKKFGDVNLAKNQYEKVKLHITLMNTIFRNNQDGGDEGTENRITFDARPILKDYIDYNFGQINISEIHISIRYTGSKDSYYMASCKKKLI